MAGVIEADFRKTASRQPQTRASRRLQASREDGQLTQDVVNAVEAPAKGKLRIPDHHVKGLFLRVTSKGAKSYILRYSAQGRRGEAALGDARAITLKTARDKALDTLSDLNVRKIDPVEAKRHAIRQEKAKKEETFAALEKRYSADAARRKRASTLAYERWLLDTHILPKLGSRRYADLRRGEIISFIEEVGAAAGGITGNRAHAVVRQVLNYALKRDLIDANPALGIDRVFPEQSRDRVLNDDELRKLWSFLEAAQRNEGLGLREDQEEGQRKINVVSPGAAIALELCLLTLQRAGEISGAHKDEFNLGERLWVIPAERMKGKRAHAVPLSPLAAERFKAALKFSKSEFAFPSRDKESAIEAKRLTRAMVRVCKALGLANAGPHDLRRTGRTMLTSERVGVGYETAERVIAHLVGSAVSRVYDRNEYLKEKRAALDAWAGELGKIVGVEPQLARKRRRSAKR
jgi:integrase